MNLSILKVAYNIIIVNKIIESFLNYIVRIFHLFYTIPKMSNENVHIQLKDHDGTDGESHKVVKEILEKVDPNVENVVFFMEAVGADGQFQKELDRANRGEVRYRDIKIWIIY